MWKLQITKYITETDTFKFDDQIQGNSLVELLAKFVLVVGKIQQLSIKQSESDLRMARLVLKNNNLNEDDIPF